MAVSYQVPLSYTINVSLTSTPTRLADFNTNSIAIFTNETANFPEAYKSYLVPTSFGKDFGTGSLTAKMSNALFTPVPNFRTGGGVLYIFPFNGVNATAGSITTVALTDNISSFKLVTNGVVNFNIDGVQTQITGLNFSSVQTVADIVTVLQAQNLDMYIVANADDSITFTSKKFGTEASITISAANGVDGTIDLYDATYFSGATVTTVAGTNASGQTLAEAVKAAQQQVYFGGVVSTQFTDDATTLANATAIQSMDCDFFNEITSLKNIASLGADIKAAGLGKTRSLVLSNSAEDAKVAIATYATIAKSVNWKGSNTANTLNLKTLTGVLPDNGLSDDYVLSANTNGVDIYGSTGGLSVVYSNDNNGYTDDIEMQLWFKKALEVAGFNALRQTNTKVSQTEQGMAILKNAYTQVCEQAITNGSVAPGTWNTPIPFGNPDDFKRSIEERGYYIYSLPIAQQSQADREARKSPVIQIAIKLSGAFHFANIIVTIER